MFFSNLFGSEPRYIRRTRVYLQEARMAMLEHSIAAEHYHATAEMYAERARRLEEEIAAYEAHKSGAAAVAPAPAGEVSKYSGPSRIEVAPPAVTSGTAGVGIVRAA